MSILLFRCLGLLDFLHTGQSFSLMYPVPRLLEHSYADALFGSGVESVLSRSFTTFQRTKSTITAR